MTSLSNFRDHVPDDVPTPDNQQPAPSTCMTLMYNGHFTLSTTHYHAPNGTWIDSCTNSLLPADYVLPPKASPAATGKPGRTSLTTPTSGACGSAGP